MAAGKTKKAISHIETKFCPTCGVSDRSMFVFSAGPAKIATIEHGYCPDHMPRNADGTPMFGKNS